MCVYVCCRLACTGFCLFATFWHLILSSDVFLEHMNCLPLFFTSRFSRLSVVLFCIQRLDSLVGLILLVTSGDVLLLRKEFPFCKTVIAEEINYFYITATLHLKLQTNACVWGGARACMRVWKDKKQAYKRNYWFITDIRNKLSIWLWKHPTIVRRYNPRRSAKLAS